MPSATRQRAALLLRLVQVGSVRESRDGAGQCEAARQVGPALQKLHAKLLDPCVGLALFHGYILRAFDRFPCRRVSHCNVGAGAV